VTSFLDFSKMTSESADVGQATRQDLFSWAARPAYDPGSAPEGADQGPASIFSPRFFTAFSGVPIHAEKSLAIVFPSLRERLVALRAA